MMISASFNYTPCDLELSLFQLRDRRKGDCDLGIFVLERRSLRSHDATKKSVTRTSFRHSLQSP